MRGDLLIVDDNVDFLRNAREILEGEAFAVRTVTTGAEAIAMLERRPPHTSVVRPDFVLLDFRLEDMTAATVLNRMDRDPALRRIPVLVVTQTCWQEDEAAALAAGATAFREKPSRVQGLRDVVVNFWKEHVHAGSSADRG